MAVGDPVDGAVHVLAVGSPVEGGIWWVVVPGSGTAATVRERDYPVGGDAAVLRYDAERKDDCRSEDVATNPAVRTRFAHTFDAA